MTLPAPTYDLMLLLDPQAEEAARAKIVADAVKAISSQGELLRQDDWGERPLAYPIDRKTSANYHLLQFHVGQTALIDGLDRSLRITDAVLRHRIIKLKPGTPDAPEMTAAQRRSEPGEADAAQAAPAEAAPAEAAQPAPAETPAPEAAPAEAPVADAPAAEAPAPEAPAAETPAAAEAPAEAAEPAASPETA